MIKEASSKRDSLRTLRDHGVTTEATVRTEHYGKPYMDMNHGFREMRDFTDYLVFEVGSQTVEVRQDLGVDVGDSRDNAIKVRYLPADPQQVAYSSSPDFLQQMQAEIRGHTMTLLFVWAVVLVPAALGALFGLCSIRPNNGSLNLGFLVIVSVAFLAIYGRLIW